MRIVMCTLALSAMSVLIFNFVLADIQDTFQISTAQVKLGHVCLWLDLWHRYGYLWKTRGSLSIKACVDIWSHHFRFWLVDWIDVANVLCTFICQMLAGGRCFCDTGDGHAHSITVFSS